MNGKGRGGEDFEPRLNRPPYCPPPDGVEVPENEAEVASDQQLADILKKIVVWTEDVIEALEARAQR